MAFDAVEEATAFSRNFVRREGWLGFVLICGVALLVFYLWSDYRQTKLITEILKDTQELHRETLDDRRVKTDAIEMNTRAMQQLGEAQRRSSDNLQSLVTVVGARIEHDRTIDKMQLEQAERFLDAIKESRAATEEARKSMEKLRIYLKKRYQIDIEQDAP